MSLPIPLGYGMETLRGTLVACAGYPCHKAVKPHITLSQVAVSVADNRCAQT